MIKHLHELGVAQVDIACRLGCSERTVRRHLALPAPPTGRPKAPRVSKLAPYQGFVDEQLTSGVWNAEVIFQLLRERGYGGGRTLLRDYIQPKRALRPSRQTVRFETDPGEQLQHDWGEVRTELSGELTRVNFAVNALGFSRRFHVWAAPSQDAEHTYESLVRAFAYFGGATGSVLVDNQKAAVLSHNSQGEVRFNEGFISLAQHYGFKPKACRPYRARTKGKTERMVGYVKHHFFQRYRAFESWHQLNGLLEQWLASVADRRVLRQFDQTPIERFAAECAALIPLPPTPFDTSYFESRRVSFDGYIEVRGQRLSVPSAHCGQSVNVRIGLDGRVRVYWHERLVAEHSLHPHGHRWHTQASHHAPLWQETLNVQRRDLAAYEALL